MILVVSSNGIVAKLELYEQKQKVLEKQRAAQSTKINQLHHSTYPVFLRNALIVEGFGKISVGSFSKTVDHLEVFLALLDVFVEILDYYVLLFDNDRKVLRLGFFDGRYKGLQTTGHLTVQRDKITREDTSFPEFPVKLNVA